MRNRTALSPWAAVLIAVLLAFLTACDRVSPNSERTVPDRRESAAERTVLGTEATEVVRMRFLSPGDHFPEERTVMNALNRKLKADGVNIEVSLIRVPWDAWGQKSNLMLATGEEFELLHVMQDLKSLGVLYSKNAIVPLNDALKKYPELVKKFPQGMWDEVTVDGKILAVPAWTTNKDGKSHGEFYYRKDLLDKLGLPVPATVDEVIDTALKLQQAIEEEQGKKSYVYNPMERPVSWLHRTYDRYPFYVDTNLGVVMVDQEGNVHSWLETEEFKNDAKVYKRMNDLGLIHPDLLILEENYEATEASFGRFAMGFESFDYSSNFVSMRQHRPEAVLGDGILEPQKGKFRYFYSWNANAVPVTSKHPEAGLKFLNWLYSSKENHDLFHYGIEGVTYTSSGPERFEPLKGADGQDLYQFDNWMTPYIAYRRIEESVPEKVFDIFKKEITDPVTVSPVTGFQFNVEPVAHEASNLESEVKKIVWPIKYGFQSYDEAFPDAIRRLKAAGLDEYLAEYERQLRAFLADKRQSGTK